MTAFQIWLVRACADITWARTFMHTEWVWPACESLHFIGLSLLAGTIFLFDLRLLGVGVRMPIRAVHALVPWGLIGYAATLVTGVLFVLAEPDQYVYNPAFQFKVLFMIAAGLNALAFYVTSYRRTTADAAQPIAPRLARAMGLASLILWLSVIVAGRLLTFYRPVPCSEWGGNPGIVATCIPE